MNLLLIRAKRRAAPGIGLLLAITVVLSGCGAPLSVAPPPTPTDTPVPTPTPTPLPTPTPTPVGAASSAAAPAATPEVTIPNGFTVVKDDRLGYSFAVPSGWTALDLRSAQFQSMAGMFGMSGQLSGLNQFLDSPQGKMLGKLYITDLSSVMFGGLPTALAVVVADAPGYTADSAKALVQSLLASNSAALGDVTIDTLETATINNLPGVRGAATANLAKVGMNATAYAKVVGLLANDKIYVMVLVCEASQRANKEPVFDQIIGTFRPE